MDGFLGAMPEAQVRQWINQVLAVAEKMGMQLAGDGTADDEAGQDAQADTAGPGAADGRAGAPAARAARAAPGAPGARASTVRAGTEPAPRRDRRCPRPTPKRARPWSAATWTAPRRRSSRNWRPIPGDPVAKTGLAQVNLIRRVSSYDQAKARRDAAEHPGDVAAQTQVADIDLASGRIEEAFDRLLGVVRRTSGEEREQARKHLVGLFEVLPPRDPNLTKARSALSALLF